MGSFLISSALGFAIYQLAVWAFISDDRLFFKIGGSVVNLTPEAATWLRRIFGVLLVGLGLSFGIWLHRPFVSLEDTLGGAVILGFFYGPLLAVWINTLIAKPSDQPLGTGQYVAGAGLALLFLVGSVGNPTGDLIQEYARKINKISFGGAEFSFVQKSSEVSALGGPLSLSGLPPTYASSSGAIGLDYLSKLGSMIHRDIEYLDMFGKIELKQEKSKLSLVDQASDQKLLNEIDSRKKNIKDILGALGKAEVFAEKTIEQPVACLIGWYSTTGDGESINRHIAGLADVFKRLPTIESGQPVNELAEEFVKQSFLIGADAVASVPSALLADKCDDLLEQFCPVAFTRSNVHKLNDVGVKSDEPKGKREKNDQLMPCLKELQFAVKRDVKTPVFAKLQQDIQPDLTGFVESRGWEARPYFAIGYASILSQLGQNQAASALLDSWIHTRAMHPTPVWSTAADWFDVRARSILVNFLEDWLKKEGQSAPTALRNEHIANLDSLRADLNTHLLEVDFFREISATRAGPPSDKLGDRFKLEDRLRNPASCFSHDPDVDLWRRIFETYVTTELSYLDALMHHPNYADQFAEEATTVATRLVAMDLSCIPRALNSNTDLVHPRARTYYAQIIDAFGSNAYFYATSHKTSESPESRQRRLSEALHTVEFGLNLIGDVARKDRDRNGSPFLKRIEGSDAVEVEEKLKLTKKQLEKLKQDQQ
jgi:hypothetical protein